MTAQESTTQKYTQAIAVAERIVATLSKRLGEIGPDTHWGHDGDAWGYLFDLTKVSDRLHGEGEYAPEED